MGMNDVSKQEIKDYRSTYWTRNKLEWKKAKVIKFIKAATPNSLETLQNKQII